MKPYRLHKLHLKFKKIQENSLDARNAPKAAPKAAPKF